MDHANNTSLWGTPREGRRFDIPDDVDAKIALTPESGEPYYFTLLDLSMHGLSFRSDQQLDPATLRVDGRLIHGTGQVVHETTSFATGTYCGIRFTPATEDDLKALIAVTEFLEAHP